MMPQDITLRQPVRLQIGRGPSGAPAQFAMLGAGLNRNVPDVVANHPFLRAVLESTRRHALIPTGHIQIDVEIVPKQ